MAKNSNLGAAKAAKNDEFYTQYLDIQKEINAYIEYNPDVFRGKTVLLPCDDPEWSNFTKFFVENFELFGLKKLISTSYAVESKKIAEWEPSSFETEAPQYDVDKSRTHGKIFILEGDADNNGRIDSGDLQWQYLEGDGDFRSDEVKALRDESDVIVTNPPFSLFREFLAWIVEAGKQFLIIGNENAISCKEVFPLIKDNKIWVGCSHVKGFIRMDGAIQEFGNICWYTNIDHGLRHNPLVLMTMRDNIKYSRHPEVKGHPYRKYENFDAIDVPYLDAIPDDYEGLMGVPITFISKYCPSQFDILGHPHGDAGVALGLAPLDKNLKKLNSGLRNGDLYLLDENGVPVLPYRRIIIRKKQKI